MIEMTSITQPPKLRLFGDIVLPIIYIVVSLTLVADAIVAMAIIQVKLKMVEAQHEDSNFTIAVLSTFARSHSTYNTALETAMKEHSQIISEIDVSQNLSIRAFSDTKGLCDDISTAILNLKLTDQNNKVNIDQLRMDAMNNSNSCT